jgi:hypothetical protein
MSFIDNRSGTVLNTIIVHQFLQGYIGAALWSTHDYRNEEDSNGFQLDDEFSDVSEACKKAMLSDCQDFIEANKAALFQFKEETGADDWRLGFLFWLNRSGHGSGFWDEKSGCEVGDKLSDACKPYGEFYLYGDFEAGVVKSHHYG